MIPPDGREDLIVRQAREWPPAERAGFLAGVCAGDSALRQRVEARVEGASGSEKPTIPDPQGAPVESLAKSGPGSMIGRYRILEKIGEGGFGVVYVAEQKEPVKRRVALKIIKLGMDTRQVVARFESERQALALMDHPNIAKVLDAGATDTGRPYFVMELVHGIRITDYCDKNNLATSERLQLFAQVCNAIQHAHQKGIIHRDIKPSNILVSLHDGTPVPKVIDFGIAKATAGQTLTDKTLYTALEQFVGTPAYMSPEQAEMTGLDIDTRTDIYSLGVLLYELLTGKTPFDASRLVKAGLDEIRRIIREEEPQRPSTRLSTLSGDDRTTTAKRRRTDPPKLIHLVRGDLDWIVMKCLEKDRTRRYETANGLGLDVKRHLNSEAIAARPPSTLYRFRKLARRNKVAFAAASLVATSLVIALAVSSWSLLQEKDARLRAETAENKALTEAERANRNAAQESDERRQAQTNELEARDRLIRLSVANGNRLIEQGDQFGGLLWFVEALRLDQNDPAHEAIHRMRIGSVLAEAPKLLKLWIHKGPISSVAFSPNGDRMATTRRGVAETAGDPASDKTAQLWDLATGAPLGPPMVHASMVWSAAFSPDGRKLLTRSGGPGDGAHEEAQVWDAQTAVPVTRPLGHTGWVDQAIFSPDSQRIALWISDPYLRTNYIYVSKLETNGPVWRPLCFQGLPWHTEGMGNSLCFSPDGSILLVRSQDPNGARAPLKVLDATKGTLTVPSWSAGAQLVAAAFSADGKLVATLSSNFTARVLRSSNGEPIGLALPHSLSYLEELAWSDDSRLLAANGRFISGGHWEQDSSGRFVSAGGEEQDSAIWDVPTGTPITKWLEGTVKFRADGYPVQVKQSSPQLGQEILQMFDPFTGEPAGPVIRYRWGSGILFHPKSLSFAKWGWDGVVWLWELASGTSPRMILQDPPGRLFGSFDESGEYVVTSSSDGSVRVARTSTGQETSTNLVQRSGCTDATVSGNGQRVVTFGTNDIAQVWNPATGQTISPPLRHSDPVVKAAILSPDGSRLATISAPPSGIGFDHWNLWEVETGKCLTDASDRYRGFFAVFSRDSKRVFSWGSAGASVSDSRTGRQICATSATAGPLESGEMGDFSPDGRWIVTPGQTCQVWDSVSGKAVGLAMKHTGRVMHAVFSPDSVRVATAGADSTARIWDAASGKPVTAPLKHPAPVHRVKFSHDGRLLATVCGDNAVRVWDPARGESVLQPLKHPGQVYEVVFRPDDRQILTACSDGRVRVWDIPRDSRPITDLVLLAELLAGRRIDQTSGLEPLDNEALHSAWETLSAKYPQQFELSTADMLARNETRAEHCEQVGLWSAAIWHLNRLIEAQPEQWKWRKWRGWLYMRLAENEKADADFAAAIQLGAPQEELWWQVAQSLQGCGRLGEALSAMERNGEQGARNAAFWVDKALMLEKTNRLDEAYQALNKALFLSPQDDFVWRATVNMANRHNSLLKAVQLFQAFVDRDETNIELKEFLALNNGIVLEQSDRLQEAYNAYSEGLQLGGVSPRSLLTRKQLLSRRSDTLKSLGRQAESIADYEKWLELSPLTADGYNDRAWRFAVGPPRERDPERALLLAQKAVGLEPTNAAYLDTLGVAYYRAGQWSRAAEALREAVKLNAGPSGYPAATDLLFLAMTYYQLGEPVKAHKYYEQALKPAEGQPFEQFRSEEQQSFKEEAAKLLGISAGASK